MRTATTDRGTTGPADLAGLLAHVRLNGIGGQSAEWTARAQDVLMKDDLPALLNGEDLPVVFLAMSHLLAAETCYDAMHKAVQNAYVPTVQAMADDLDRAENARRSAETEATTLDKLYRAECETARDLRAALEAEAARADGYREQIIRRACQEFEAGMRAKL